MSLPIAHGTVGWVLHRLDGRRTRFTGWGRALTFIAVANLPDIDFLFGFIVGRPGVFHRGVTHTVLAALLFGGIAGLACRRLFGDRWLPAASMFAAVYCSHLLLDAFTIHERGPAGGQFFWPFSDAYIYSPVLIFREIVIDGDSRTGFLRTIFAWRTLFVLSTEAVFAMVVVGTSQVIVPWLRRVRERGLAVSLAPAREEDLA